MIRIIVLTVLGVVMVILISIAIWTILDLIFLYLIFCFETLPTRWRNWNRARIARKPLSKSKNK